MSSNIDLSIIILSWNTKQLLQNCLESIFAAESKRPKAKGFNYEIIMVDNNSTDGSKKYLKSLESKGLGYRKKPNSKPPNPILFKVIFNDRNLGFAKGNNQGIKKAEGEYVLLLNSDTVILDDAIQKTLNFMKKNKNIDICGCKLLNEDKTIQPSVGRFPNLFNVFKMLFLDRLFKQTGSAWSMTSPNQTKPVDWITGAFMMAKKSVFDDIGGLDENIFMYFEEVEWCYRAHQKGKQVFFYPDAKIIHLGGGSSPSGKTGPILHIYQGLVYFYQKHKPAWQEFLVRFMLKIKAAVTYFLGLITNNRYLKKTYGQAFKLV